VLDLLLPDLSGLELQDQLARAGHTQPIVFLSGHGSVPASVRAMKKGALDFLTKPVDEADLLAAIGQAIARHEEGRAARAAAAEGWELVARLTPRERTVMDLVVAGLLNKQIASELGISEATVKVHRGRVMRKLGVTSVADLVRLAAQATGSPEGPPPHPDAGRTTKV
jgi:FixJ family two-component response regulator